jgi:hypothetical protein
MAADAQGIATFLLLSKASVSRANGVVRHLALADGSAIIAMQFSSAQKLYGGAGGHSRNIVCPRVVPAAVLPKRTWLTSSSSRRRSA